MIYTLSINDIMALSGCDISKLPDDSTFETKYTYSSDVWRSFGKMHSYAIDVLEGKNYLPETPEFIVNKLLEMKYIYSFQKDNLIAALKLYPAYLRSNLTKNLFNLTKNAKQDKQH